MSQEYLALQERKRKWIPLACIGKCSISQASKRIGITPNSVSVLKRRYRLYGDSIFINGHKGKSYQNRNLGVYGRQILPRYPGRTAYRLRWRPNAAG